MHSFSLILLVIYYRFPLLSPPVRQLSRFGKPAELLAEAEEELATLPQLATDDMFITEHYFIETSKYGIAIVPIREIIWVYQIILPCTNFSGIISAFPIRCTLRQTSIYISTVRKYQVRH